MSMKSLQDTLEKLKSQFERLGKEPIIRRTQAILKKHDELRSIFWNQIYEAQKDWLPDDPPEEYKKLLYEADVLNKAIIKKLELFGYNEENEEEAAGGEEIYQELKESLKPDDNFQETMKKVNLDSSDVKEMMKAFIRLSTGPTHIKPKELEIKPFEGNILEYQGFKATVNRVLSHGFYEDGDKFEHLKTYLKGTVFESVQYLQAVEGSYQEAWLVLDAMYEQPRAILNSIIDTFYAAEFTMKAGDLESILKFKNLFNQVVGNLTMLKTTLGDIVQAVCVNRMDDVSRTRFEDFLGFQKVPPSIEQIRQFLLKEVTAATHVHKLKLTALPTNAAQQNLSSTLNQNQKNYPSNRNPHHQRDNKISKTMVTTKCSKR